MHTEQALPILPLFPLCLSLTDTPTLGSLFKICIRMGKKVKITICCGEGAHAENNAEI